MVIGLERGADSLHIVHLMPLPPPPIIFCFIKVHNGFTFLVSATQVVLGKRLLNECSFGMYNLQV